MVPHSRCELPPKLGDPLLGVIVERERDVHRPMQSRGQSSQIDGIAGVACAARSSYVRPSCFRRAVREDEPLKQRVGREAVGAVEARARCLAAREQPGDGGLAVETSAHTAAKVMRGGHHRNWVFGDIEALRLLAVRGNVREVVEDFLGGLVADVKQHVRVAAALELVVDGARHDVARRELSPRVVRGHETLAGGVVQQPPRAAHGLGDEERCAACRGGLVVQARRVELHELEVGHRRASAHAQRHAVAGGYRRIRRRGIHLAGAPGRNQRRVREKPRDLARARGNRVRPDA
mmetsp:Transcript_15085/g.62755  ORF Transcript_15085/g.62755 Transcript_15085/m.62755 type:complete len:292 (-) Transcript_15085:644-1519(-)